MNTLTLALSTHRLETLKITANLMEQSDLILLEEPPHPDFHWMLEGRCAIEEHLLELDIEYPLFVSGQYQLLRTLHKQGKKILQVEPFWQYLYQIQDFLADGHGPQEIDRTSVLYSVYEHERIATGRLIAYYKAVRGSKFDKILKTMDLFARADAARFRLRDELRANAIMGQLRSNHGSRVYVEAGAIHLLLNKYLAERLAAFTTGWQMHTHFIEQEVTRSIGGGGRLVSPGDELTLEYMFDRPVRSRRSELLCAQALIYTKLVRKEEYDGEQEGFPHTINDMETIRIVRRLGLAGCRELFFALRSLDSVEASEYVQKYLSMN